MSIFLLGDNVSSESWAMKHLMQTLNFTKANHIPNLTTRVGPIGFVLIHVIIDSRLILTLTLTLIYPKDY